MNTAFVAATPVSSSHTALAGHAVCNRRPVVENNDFQQAKWTMGRVSKFGPFTPAVIATRLIIGDKRLNKLRGKAISLHSQAITAFCEFTGAGPKMRQNLIRVAKKNGDTLGFLS